MVAFWNLKLFKGYFFQLSSGDKEQDSEALREEEQLQRASVPWEVNLEN